MKKLLRFVVIPVLATALTATLGLTGASASDSFTWIAADLFLCPGRTPCPDEAVASSTGDRITIVGNGGLTLHPKTIDGGGTFTATALEVGGSYVEGKWEAVELLSFKSYGPGVGPPPNFHSGLAMIRIHLIVDDAWVADAILRLGCRLPDANFPPSTIEGVRVNVQDGLNFNMEVDPRATLFIEL